MNADPLARLRSLCLAFPEATEQEAWGEPTFRVRGKIFAMYAGNHHGDARRAVWCKAALGVQESVVGSDPGRYFVPPYVGPAGWIGVVIDGCDERVLREHVAESYCLVAPRKLADRVDA